MKKRKPKQPGPNKATGTLHDLLPKAKPYKYVFPSLSRKLAAQCWCDKRTEKKAMDVVLCEVFAEMLDTQMQCANLGCATTGQLLREIMARVDLNYSTVFYEEPKKPAPPSEPHHGKRIRPRVGFDRWLRDCAEYAMQSEWMIDPDMPDWFTWYSTGFSPKDAVHRLFAIVRSMP